MSVRLRFAVAAMIGLCGLVVMIAIIVTSGVTVSGIPRYCLASFLGATVAGLATAPLFGRAGRRGAGLALLGAVLATGGGAAVGGAVYALGIDPLAGFFFGPAMVIDSALRSPVVVLVLAGSLAAAHHGARTLRAPVSP